MKKILIASLVVAGTLTLLLTTGSDYTTLKPVSATEPVTQTISTPSPSPSAQPVTNSPESANTRAVTSPTQPGIGGPQVSNNPVPSPSVTPTPSPTDTPCTKVGNATSCNSNVTQLDQ